jgi:hypothetical protein
MWVCTEPALFEVIRLLHNPVLGIIVFGQDTHSVGFRHDCKSLLLNCLYRRRVGLEAILHFQVLGMRVGAWVTRHWETQSSHKIGPFSFGNRGFFYERPEIEAIILYNNFLNCYEDEMKPNVYFYYICIFLMIWYQN